ncbi:MAG: leukocidin family pore-forming toxin [Pseudomonadota bacterium]
MTSSIKLSLAAFAAGALVSLPAAADSNICTHGSYKKGCWEDQTQFKTWTMHPYREGFHTDYLKKKKSSITDDTDLRYAYIRDEEGFHYIVVRNIGQISVVQQIPGEVGNPDIAGYALAKFHITVQLNNRGWKLFATAPKNANGTTTVSSTTGMSFNFGGSSSAEDPVGVSAGISLSRSNTQSHDIKDFEIINKGGGNTKKWEFNLTKYMFENCGSGDNGWVHAAPPMSANGFEPMVEAVWKKKLPATTRPERIDIKVVKRFCGAAWYKEDDSCPGGTNYTKYSCFTRTETVRVTPHLK